MIKRIKLFYFKLYLVVLSKGYAVGVLFIIEFIEVENCV